MHELYWYWLQFPQALCHLGANLEVPFYVLMNAGLDHPAVFFMFQRRAVFIDQPPQFIQEEVIASDPIIEIVDGILHTLWVGPQRSTKITKTYLSFVPFCGWVCSQIGRASGRVRG